MTDQSDRDIELVARILRLEHYTQMGMEPPRSWDDESVIYQDSFRSRARRRLAAIREAEQVA